MLALVSSLLVAPAFAQDGGATATDQRTGPITADPHPDLSSEDHRALDARTLKTHWTMNSGVDILDTDDWLYRTGIKVTDGRTSGYLQPGFRVYGGEFSRFDLEAGIPLPKGLGPLSFSVAMPITVSPTAWSATPLLAATAGGPAGELKFIGLTIITGGAFGADHDAGVSAPLNAMPIVGAFAVALDDFNSLGLSGRTAVIRGGTLAPTTLTTSYRMKLGLANQHNIVGSVATTPGDWSSVISFDYQYVLRTAMRVNTTEVGSR
jgi:hypothetical protein